MTITTHAAVGTALGLHLGSPVLGFVIGVISHFLIDLIPHGDGFLSDQLRIHHQKKAPVTFGTLDAIIAIFLVLIVFREANVTSPTVFFAAVVGSVLPDILVGLYDITKSKYLYGTYRLHFFFHDFFIHRYKDIKLPYSLVAQVGLVALILFFS